MAKVEKQKTPSLAEQAMELIPKPSTVEVEVIKDMAGIKPGHTKKLEISLANKLVKSGHVKIIQTKKSNKEDEK